MKCQVICSNREYDCDDLQFPPIGTKGTVLDLAPDADGELDIEFDNYPCPTLDGSYWVTHKSMIIFIDDKIEDDVCELAKEKRG